MRAGKSPIGALIRPSARLPGADWPCLFCIGILSAGAFAVYSGTFSVPLLYDDSGSIAANPSIRRIWSGWSALRPPNDAGVGGRPLLNLSFALNYALGGDAVLGYHVANLVIHVLASWTLFGVVRNTLCRPGLADRFGRSATALALAVSAVWAWHPLQTISVTYISQRAESLMGLFYLLTVYCFARRADREGKASRRLWFSLSVLSCLAGAATKEVMATAPLMVLLYDRTFVSGSFSAAWRRNWRLYTVLAAALFPIGHRVLILHRGGVVSGVGFGGGIAWWDYALTECRVVLRYILLSFWPQPLVFDYGRSLPCHLPEIWPYALVLASLLAASAVALRRSPAVGFLACWFFLILAPTSSVIPVVGQSMAENRMYLPLAAIVAAAVLGAFAWVGRMVLPLCAVAAVGLGFASSQRNRSYQSELAIWSDTVAKAPANARAHGNLGRVLAGMPDRRDDAIAQYEEAVRLDPAAAEVHVNLGNLWFRAPRHLDDAIAQYGEALRLRPYDADAHYDLACGLARKPGRLDAAVAEYKEALRLKPEFAAAHLNLGNALLRIPGRSGEAIAHYEEALRQRPDWAEAHFALGMALLSVPGRSDEARGHLRAVMRIQPGNDEVREILGNSRPHP
jgi:tetratricopeptide (TPR) repeat protein